MDLVTGVGYDSTCAKMRKQGTCATVTFGTGVEGINSVFPGEEFQGSPEELGNHVKNWRDDRDPEKGFGAVIIGAVQGANPELWHLDIKGGLTQTPWQQNRLLLRGQINSGDGYWCIPSVHDADTLRQYMLELFRSVSQLNLCVGAPFVFAIARPGAAVEYHTESS